ncbi:MULTISPECIES: hypothetical protein [unclassified Janthinobacterium]|uniref:hypothetical protein n=1 Tax=unclassified Janthinobacterium TaxID=2610881 RepID=UPI0016189DA0|nr:MULTISPECIES: hypothetical protein [unclassified Janthinobacterium]MBB5369872.1 hypothetical protein [Janthinobacterium sp. K2C7]MBB5382678.1 hypothetical protein [Janthinobacterium sp. K2Li3]MBB5384663.1 hypothetical protein [Janthinobacterium sp. K2E3]
MTRERLEDFSLLKDYLKKYNIQDNIKNKLFLENLKAIHKSYFSLLTWSGEIKFSEGLFKYKSIEISKEINELILESFSDIGSSIFNWTYGGYKTSRVMLRSAIENFIRAISGIEKKEQLQEKNIYSLFDGAATLIIFKSSEEVKASFKQLHSDYKELCRDVHSALPENMEKISTLSDLPKFDAEKSKKCCEIICRVTKNILILLCLIFFNFFHSMHHRNKENILISLPKKIKPFINGMNEI